jgi:hypothetical protein
VSVELTGAWTQIPSEGSRRYQTDHQFVFFAGVQAPSIDHAVDNHARHKLRPFGSSPAVSDIVVDGQQAKLIEPSADAPALMRGYPPAAVAIIDVGRIFTIGDTSYGFVTVTADVVSIRGILTAVDIL